CLATPTASGKSLVFMSVAANLIKRNANATILALYPAKALIQDQLNKWHHILSNFESEPGYIDGGVPTAQRAQILAKQRVVLMTPDVTHAWLMSHLQEPAVSSFLGRLCLLVLDEAHVYDGVFGTNMAYFLRRLQCVSRPFKIVSSTATIGEPEAFLDRLTGRRPITFRAADDASASPAKAVIAIPPRGEKTFDGMTCLLSTLARGEHGSFLAFADSRKMVEQLVAVSMRDPKESDGDDDIETAQPGPSHVAAKVLPYRAGYEEEDRLSIQKALERGNLAGVVSTSALELGLDIGSIDIVLLLGTPPTVKAFWQRIGRAGRRNDGICVVIDDTGIICNEPRGLRDYMSRSPEPGWLYLDNRFIQYANVLCAAVELSSCTRGEVNREVFSSLPPQFESLLNNELNPTEMVPDELYPLKQRAQAGPHYEFPLRNAIEKGFTIKAGGGPQAQLGSVTLSQALREAYPGAVYYCMARPYRVAQFNYRSGEIIVRPEKRYTTAPVALNMVFPKFPAGILRLAQSPSGFVAESEIQVSERVTGFREKRGSNTTSNLYERGSPYSQQPVARFFETTGVCWFFQDPALLTEAIAECVLQAFCTMCGVQTRDVGLGIFHTNTSPLDGTTCKGMAIYDATHGSLRLTQQLAERFGEIVEFAESLMRAREKRDIGVELALHALGTAVSALELARQPDNATPAAATDWVRVIAPGQKAMRLMETGASEEVVVKGYRYTPQGLMYDLVSPRPDVNWSVKAALIRPINGQTATIEGNLVTGETR
ncbi:MAG: hypothetical protein A3G24_19280, partial [Betaproteobacteria bacterium RIFCSPLOWO2_12_FULL_62_13]